MSLDSFGTIATKESHVQSVSIQGANNTSFLKLSHGNGGAEYEIQLPTANPGNVKKGLYISDGSGTPLIKTDWTNTQFEGDGIQTALINSSIPYLIKRYVTPTATGINGASIFTTAGDNEHTWTAASLFLGIAKRVSGGATPTTSDILPSVAQVMAIHTAPALVDGDSWELIIIKDTADVNMNWNAGTGWVSNVGAANINLQAGTTTTFRFIVTDTASKILVLPVARVF